MTNSFLRIPIINKYFMPYGSRNFSFSSHNFKGKLLQFVYVFIQIPLLLLSLRLHSLTVTVY